MEQWLDCTSRDIILSSLLIGQGTTIMVFRPRWPRDSHAIQEWLRPARMTAKSARDFHTPRRWLLLKQTASSFLNDGPSAPIQLTCERKEPASPNSRFEHTTVCDLTATPEMKPGRRRSPNTHGLRPEQLRRTISSRSGRQPIFPHIYDTQQQITISPVSGRLTFGPAEPHTIRAFPPARFLRQPVETTFTSFGQSRCESAPSPCFCQKDKYEW